MKKFQFLLLLSILPFLSRAQSTINATIMHDQIERSYILYVPASYDADKPSALVLCYHGFGSSANTIWYYSGFNKIADTANFLIAYPQGTLLDDKAHWNVGGWTLNSSTDDLGFTNALLDSISVDYSIDPSKVYATGMSNGGFMSFLLACQLSNRIAAVASVTGSMTPETYNSCDPQRPIPVLQIHGTGDGTVPYAGAAYSKPIYDVLHYWAGFNQTNSVARKDSIANTNTSDGSTAEKVWFAAGDSCSSVTHYRIIDGGHAWPGAFGNLDINASAVIWDFFSQHDINGKIQCDSDNYDAVLSNKPKEILSDLKVYPNPSSSFITLDSKSDFYGAYEVISIDGRIVLRGSLKADANRIDIAMLDEGLYVLKLGQQTVKFIKEN